MFEELDLKVGEETKSDNKDVAVTGFDTCGSVCNTRYVTVCNAGC